MFTLIALVVCVQPGAWPRQTNVVLSEGSYKAVATAHNYWLTGSRTFETEYGKCTITKLTVGRKL